LSVISPVATGSGGALRYRSLWLSIGWVGVALVVYESLTSTPLHVDVPYYDKFGHTFAYCTLALWFAQLYTTAPRRLLIALGFIAMGVALEFVQALTPTRSFEYADMVANTIGALTGYLLARHGLGNVLAAFEKRWLAR
jgi:VanZ family protein